MATNGCADRARVHAVQRRAIIACAEARYYGAVRAALYRHHTRRFAEPVDHGVQGARWHSRPRETTTTTRLGLKLDLVVVGLMAARVEIPIILLFVRVYRLEYSVSSARAQHAAHAAIPVSYESRHNARPRR